MRKPEVTVVIIEDNATRAKLYAHWLDHVEVRVALTKRQVFEEVDEDVTVAILAEEFGNDDAEKVLELIRSRTRFCQVLTTSRDRQKEFPSLDVDNHLVKPIFEADLRERVERIARQTVYAEMLAEYYRTTVMLTSAQKSESDDAAEREAELKDRVADLKAIVSGLRRELDEEDLYVAMDLISPAEDPPAEELESGSSKYVPNKCSKCGRKWGVGRGTDPSKGVMRLGSHVWRCVDCGAIHMNAAARNPHFTHSR